MSADEPGGSQQGAAVETLDIPAGRVCVATG
jgi:hypothetical protein